MAIFVVLWSYLLTTKLSCLQKNNFGHTRPWPGSIKMSAKKGHYEDIIFNIIMLFCFQNCSDLLCEKNVLVIQKKIVKFEAEGQEFAKNCEITRTIYSNSERSEQFLKQMFF